MEEGFWEWLINSIRESSEETRMLIKILTLTLGGSIGIALEIYIVGDYLSYFLSLPVSVILIFLWIARIIWESEKHERYNS